MKNEKRHLEYQSVFLSVLQELTEINNRLTHKDNDDSSYGMTCCDMTVCTG